MGKATSFGDDRDFAMSGLSAALGPSSRHSELHRSQQDLGPNTYARVCEDVDRSQLPDHRAVPGKEQPLHPNELLAAAAAGLAASALGQMCLVLQPAQSEVCTKTALLAEACLAAAGACTSTHHVSASALVGVWLGMRGDGHSAQEYVGRALNGLSGLRISPGGAGLGSSVLYLRQMWCPLLGWIPPRPGASVGTFSPQGIGPTPGHSDHVLGAVSSWQRPEATDSGAVPGIVLARAQLAQMARDPFNMGRGTTDEDDGEGESRAISGQDGLGIPVGGDTPTHSQASTSKQDM